MYIYIDIYWCYMTRLYAHIWVYQINVYTWINTHFHKAWVCERICMASLESRHVRIHLKQMCMYTCMIMYVSDCLCVYKSFKTHLYRTPSQSSTCQDVWCGLCGPSGVNFQGTLGSCCSLLSVLLGPSVVSRRTFCCSRAILVCRGERW